MSLTPWHRWSRSRIYARSGTRGWELGEGCWCTKKKKRSEQHNLCMDIVADAVGARPDSPWHGPFPPRPNPTAPSAKARPSLWLRFFIFFFFLAALPCQVHGQKYWGFMPLPARSSPPSMTDRRSGWISQLTRSFVGITLRWETYTKNPRDRAPTAVASLATHPLLALLTLLSLSLLPPSTGVSWHRLPKNYLHRNPCLRIFSCGNSQDRVTQGALLSFRVNFFFPLCLDLLSKINFY